MALVAQVGGGGHQRAERCRQKPVPLLAGVCCHAWSIGRMPERSPAFRLRAPCRVVQPFLRNAG